MSRLSRMTSLSASFVLVASLAGCEQKPAAQNAKSPAAPTLSAGDVTATPALPASFFLTAAPDGAQDVKAAKAALKRGDNVVLRGRIGGSVDPFVENRAVFTLMDKALPACSDNPDDACETPWDYCCETREDIVANAATIQIVDAAGMPLKINVKNEHGLKPLTELVVVGTVSQRDDAGNLVINATGMFVAAAN